MLRPDRHGRFGEFLHHDGKQIFLALSQHCFSFRGHGHDARFDFRLRISF
jgi:hypothetical protein